MNTRTILIAVALLAGASAVHAQDGRLDRVENLIATGRLTEARNTLTAWERDNGPLSDATAEDRARALYLVGALTSDVAEAEDAFVGVVLSYPSSQVAPKALLRLGQGLYTAGETDRAIMFLERLRSDYPRSTERETGLLWLTRAQLARGDAAAACGTARESLFGTTNENVRTLLEIERDRACAQSGGIAAGADERRGGDTRPVPALDANPALSVDTTSGRPSPRTPPRQDVPPAVRRDPPAAPRQDSAAAPRQEPAAPVRRANPLPDLGVAVDENVRQPPTVRADTARAGTTQRTDRDARTTDATRTPPADPNARADDAPRNNAASGPEYAVQTAAFSERRPAETIAAEMRAKGFDARIVQVPGSPYFRVRCGAYANSSDAAAAALRIRDAGFATLIVNDVRLERAL
ncbi:MAG TPA: SPOR domain-containing protein [Longimicrobiales bacterium]|nr:SPOR domain-containing protein [Longimicrobiales bacterium]